MQAESQQKPVRWSGRSPMSDEHKQALAEGREQGRGVRLYLEALERYRPKRGRKRTAESIQKRLSVIEEGLRDADPLSRLHLLQEQMNLQAELESMGAKADIKELEYGFVAAARSYGERKGISYNAWRELGVSAEVLRRAGISRSSS
jgi:GTP cyclohydrolase II